MQKYCYIGSAKHHGSDRIVLVRTPADNFMTAGNIVEFHIGDHRHLAEVIDVAMVPKDGNEERVMADISPIYDVEKIYGLAWETKENKEDA